MALVSVHRGVVIESFKTVGMQVELFSVKPAKVCKGLEAQVFLLDAISTLSSVVYFEYQDFRQHQHVRPSAATDYSFGGSDSPRSPGGIIAGGTRGGGVALHPPSRDEGLCSAVPSNINVVSVPPVSTVESRGDSTATSTASAAVQDIATNEGITLCEFRSQQYQSRGNAFTRGSIHAVRRIQGPSVIVPSAALVSVSETTIKDVDVCEESVTEVDLPDVAPSSARASISEETVTEDVVCEESKNVVDIPVVVPSAELVSVSEETITGDVDVSEESEDVVDIPDAVSSAELVSVSEQTSKDVDVCEKSEIGVDTCVVADFDSLQTNPGQYAVRYEPIKSLTDTKLGVAMRSPEVGLEDCAMQVQVGSENGAHVRGLEAKAHDDTEGSGVKEKMSVDGAIGRHVCAGRKVVGESTADLPEVVFACLKSECLPSSSGPLLAAPG